MPVAGRSLICLRNGLRIRGRVAEGVLKGVGYCLFLAQVEGVAWETQEEVTSEEEIYALLRDSGLYHPDCSLFPAIPGREVVSYLGLKDADVPSFSLGGTRKAPPTET